MCISHRWRASLYLHVCQHQSHEQRVKIRVPCPRSLGSQMPRGENAKSANLRFGERERNNVRGAAHGRLSENGIGIERPVVWRLCFWAVIEMQNNIRIDG